VVAVVEGSPDPDVAVFVEVATPVEVDVDEAATVDEASSAPRDEAESPPEPLPVWSAATGSGPHAEAHDATAATMSD